MTRRVVLRERVIVRKRTVSKARRVRAKLRRETVDIRADDGVDVYDERAGEPVRSARSMPRMKNKVRARAKAKV